MRKSTQNALAEAERRLKRDGYALTPDGLRYHGGPYWVGRTVTDDLVLVEVPTAFKADKPEEVAVYLYPINSHKELKP